MRGLGVVTFRHGPFWNFSYLLACAETREAAVIDPAWDVEAILRAAARERLAIRQILVTHAHTDHVNGVAELVARTGATVFAHALEGDGLLAAGVTEFTTFAGPESVEIGAHELLLIPSPGHSPGSTSIISGGRLFTGDTLHIGGVGRPGTYGGALTDQWRSIRTLLNCAPETVIHPGHDEGRAKTSTLGEEAARVAALRAETPEEFAREMQRATGWAYEV